MTKTTIMEEPHEKVIGTIQPVLAPFDRRGNVKILLINVFKYVKTQLILRFSHDAFNKLIISLQQPVTQLKPLSIFVKDHKLSQINRNYY